LMLAEEEERPDAFEVGWLDSTTISQWIMDDVIIELTEYLPEYAPDFWEFINRPENELTKRSITDDEGRYWYVPGLRESFWNVTYQGPMIRQDWLDECGLDMPTTMEDLEAVLVAFNEKYGAKLAGTLGDFNNGGFASGTGAHASLSAQFYVDDNGKVQCANVQPEWKEFVGYIAKWYDMDLIDADFFTADRALVRQKALDNETGCMFSAMSHLTNMITDARDNETGANWVGMPYLRTAAGEPTSFIQTSASLYDNSSGVYITTSCPEEKIGLILNWVNYAFTEEGQKYYNFGKEGVSYEMVDGKEQWTEVITEDPLGREAAMAKYCIWWSTSFGIQMSDFVRLKNDPVAGEAVDIWTENTVANKYMFPSVSRTEEEDIIYLDKWAACSTLINERALEFVTGDASLDDFDKFVEELNKLGLEDVLSVQQAAYDRFMSK